MLKKWRKQQNNINNKIFLSQTIQICLKETISFWGDFWIENFKCLRANLIKFTQICIDPKLPSNAYYWSAMDLCYKMNGWGNKAPLETAKQWSKQCQWEQLALGCVHLGSDGLQGQRLHYLTVPAFGHPHSEKKMILLVFKWNFKYLCGTKQPPTPFIYQYKCGHTASSSYSGKTQIPRSKIPVEKMILTCAVE